MKIKQLLFLATLLMSSNVFASQVFTSEDLKAINYTVQDGPTCGPHNVATIINLMSKEKVTTPYQIYNAVPHYWDGTYAGDIQEYVNGQDYGVSMAMVFSSPENLDKNLETYSIISVLVKSSKYYNSSDGSNHFITIIGEEDDSYIVLDTNEPDFVKVKKEKLLYAAYPGSYFTYNVKQPSFYEIWSKQQKEQIEAERLEAEAKALELQNQKENVNSKPEQKAETKEISNDTSKVQKTGTVKATVVKTTPAK